MKSTILIVIIKFNVQISKFNVNKNANLNNKWSIMTVNKRRNKIWH